MGQRQRSDAAVMMMVVVMRVIMAVMIVMVMVMVMMLVSRLPQPAAHICRLGFRIIKPALQQRRSCHRRIADDDRRGWVQPPQPLRQLLNIIL